MPYSASHKGFGTPASNATNAKKDYAGVLQAGKPFFTYKAFYAGKPGNYNHLSNVILRSAQTSSRFTSLRISCLIPL